MIVHSRKFMELIFYVFIPKKAFKTLKIRILFNDTFC